MRAYSVIKMGLTNVHVYTANDANILHTRILMCDKRVLRASSERAEMCVDIMLVVVGMDDCRRSVIVQLYVCAPFNLRNLMRIHARPSVTQKSVGVLRSLSALVMCVFGRCVVCVFCCVCIISFATWPQRDAACPCRQSHCSSRRRLHASARTRNTPVRR